MKVQPADYRLVWREFRRTLIHEMVTTFRTDGLGGLKLLILNPPHIEIVYPSGCRYHFDPEQTQPFVYGFPLPKSGGPISERNGIERIPLHRIYMDDVYLCGECGRIHEDGAPDSRPTWVDDFQTRIDPAAMFAAIEQRRGKKEFEIRSCAYRKLCFQAVERFRESFKRKVELERWEAESAERAARAEKERKEWIAKDEEFLRKLHAPLSEVVEECAPARAVYVVGVTGQNGMVKIGIANRVEKRVRSLQTSCPFPIQLLKSWKCADARSSEVVLHTKYAQFRRSGEWFHLPDEILTALLSVDTLDNFLKVS